MEFVFQGCRKKEFYQVSLFGSFVPLFIFLFVVRFSFLPQPRCFFFFRFFLLFVGLVSLYCLLCLIVSFSLMVSSLFCLFLRVYFSPTSGTTNAGKRKIINCIF